MKSILLINHLQPILGKLVFPCCLLLTIPCFAQKIKIKQGIIYADKKPVYTIVETSKERQSQSPKTVLLSMDGDTLIRIAKHRIDINRANYETEGRSIDYYEFEIEGTDTVLSYASTETNDFYKDLVKLGFLDADSIDQAKFETFKRSKFDKLIAVDLSKKAMNQREIITSMSGYYEYSKKATSRSPNAKLTLQEGVIMFDASKELVQSGIGRVERSLSAGRTSYKVFSSQGQRLVATLEFDITPGQLTVTTAFDDASINLPTSNSHPIETHLLNGIRYLIDAGYL